MIIIVAAPRALTELAQGQLEITESGNGNGNRNGNGNGKLEKVGNWKAGTETETGTENWKRSSGGNTALDCSYHCC